MLKLPCWLLGRQGLGKAETDAKAGSGDKERRRRAVILDQAGAGGERWTIDAAIVGTPRWPYFGHRFGREGALAGGDCGDAIDPPDCT